MQEKVTKGYWEKNKGYWKKDENYGYYLPVGTVWLNGEYIPAEELKVSMDDLAFLKGDAVYDALRTFGGKPFRLEEHLDRLYRSLTYTKIDPKMTKEEMKQITLNLLDKNRHLLGEDDDFSIVQRITRGRVHRSFILSLCTKPTVLIYNTPIFYKKSEYGTGIKMHTTLHREIPPQCVDPRAKCQARMNYVLAYLEALDKDQESLPLLMDLQGNVTESWGSNFFIVSRGKIVTSTTRTVLGGITRQVVLELAQKLGLPAVECDFGIYDVYNADEAFTTATSYAIMPVRSVNDRKIGDVVPGPITKCLTQAFIQMVNFDFIKKQAEKLSKKNNGLEFVRHCECRGKKTKNEVDEESRKSK